MVRFLKISVATVLLLPFAGCGADGTSAGDSNDKVRFETISIEPVTSSLEKVRVTFRVTNTAARKIVRVKATISVLDGSGSEMRSRPKSSMISSRRFFGRLSSKKNCPSFRRPR